MGFPTLLPNELRDFTAAVLTEVYSGVRVKPPLQSLTGETLRSATANNEDGACVDVSASEFWEVNIRMHFMMSKYLMLMHLHIVVPKYLHF